MKKLLVLLLFIASCTLQAQEDDAETPRIAIRLALGDSINIDGVLVKFAEVIEDSRCPVNVTCVWEGRAKVKVEVTEEGMETDEKIVIIGKVLPNESKDKVLCEQNDFSLKATHLVPYPQYPAKRLNYVLLIDRSKND